MPLFTGPAKTGSFTGVLAQGTFTAADFKTDIKGYYLKGWTMSDLVALMERGGANVKVYTKAFPGGEITGQVK